MTSALIGIAVALLVGALVAVVAVYLYFVATGDLDMTADPVDLWGLDLAEEAAK